jgi:cytochrome b
MAKVQRTRELMLPMKVWDGPIRLFHWGIALLVITSFVTQYQGWMQLHFLSGYAMLTALLFRVVWGFAGSDTARFGRFLKSPVAAVQYLGRIGRREPDTQVGHTAAGGWMVLVLLLLLAMQVGTGLFSNDDVNARGPLALRVGKAISDTFSHWHAVNFWLILAGITLHVLVVGAYAVLKGQNLVRPMITGKKRLPGRTPAPRLRSPLLAGAIFTVSAGLVWAALWLLA